MQRKVMGFLCGFLRKPAFSKKFVRFFCNTPAESASLNKISNLSSPQAIADYLFLMSSSQTFRKNPVFLEETLEIFSRYPLETVEKLSLEVLLLILKEISLFSAKEQREKALFFVNSLLLTHIQRQNIQGLFQILLFFQENQQIFADFWQQSRSEFLVKCLQNNYEYFAFANSVDILTFLPIISLLSAPPFSFPESWLQKGPAFKLKNRNYQEKTLILEEIQGLLALDESFLREKAVVSKFLEFCAKNQGDFANLQTHFLVKMLKLTQFMQFDCDMTSVEILEAAVLKKIFQALAEKHADLDEWLSILAYYSSNSKNSESKWVFLRLVEENMINLLVKSLQSKQKKLSDREILQVLEVLAEFATVSQKKSVELLAKQQILEENANIYVIYLYFLYKHEPTAENSSEFAIFQAFVSNLHNQMLQKKPDFLKTILYSCKTLALLTNFPIKTLEIQIESLINASLQLPIVTLLKEPYEFVSILSLKSAKTAKNASIFQKSLSNSSLKTLEFNTFMALHHAVCAQPAIHEVFVAFFEKKLQESTKEASLDLVKIAFICKSFINIKDFLSDAKKSRTLKDKQYVGTIERILRLLQENLLRKILQKQLNNSFKTQENIFEDEDAKKPKESEKKDGLLEKSNEFSDIPLVNLFKELEIAEICVIYRVFEALVAINMGSLPIYYLFWRLIERFYEKMSFSQLVDWLFLLGICNRLPREFPSNIANIVENEENARKLQETPQILKLLWVVLLKNSQEVPLKLVDLLSNKLKSEEFPLKTLDLELRVRLFQLILYLQIQENRVFDPLLGLSAGNVEILKKDYEFFLRKSRRSLRNVEGLSPFEKEIEDYLRKYHVSFQREVLLRYEDFPIVLLNYEVKQDNNQGYLFIMDSSIFLGSSNVERIEGWLLRKYLKVLKIKTKFLELQKFYALERRHEKNDYLRSKLKGLKIEVRKERKFYYDF